MCFKKLCFAGLILFLGLTHSFAAEKWNILIAGWRDLSPQTGSGIPDMIRRSIVAQLVQLSNMNVITTPEGTKTFGDWDDVVSIGRTNRADVVIYGDFYMDNGKLVLFVEIFDVLKQQLRLRRGYEGEMGIDIFDTVDNITADMIQNIKEALPEISYEEQVQIQEIRRQLYEQETVNVSRLFCTHFGIIGQFGNKNMTWMNYDSTMGEYYLNYNDDYNTYRLMLGLTFQYQFLRLQIHISHLIGLPTLQSGNNFTFINKTGFVAPFFIFFHTSFFMPFLDNKLAAGFGIQQLDIPIEIDMQSTDGTYDQNKFEKYSMSGKNIISFNLIFHPNDRLELFLAFNPFNHGYDTYTSMSSDGYTNTTVKIFDAGFFQPIVVGVSFFPFRNRMNSFGIEFRLMYMDYEFTENRYFYDSAVPGYVNKVEYQTSGTIISLYLGILYRLDLTK